MTMGKKRREHGQYLWISNRQIKNVNIIKLLVYDYKKLLIKHF